MFVKRFFFDVAFVGALFFAPWWAVLAWGIAGVLIFQNYYEALLVGILFDLLYGGVNTSLSAGFGFMGLVVSAVIMFLLEWLKREWRS